MKMISSPTPLRWIAFLVLLSVPIVALQLLLIYQIPFWQLPYRNIRVWLVVAGLLSLPLAVWFLQAKRAAFYFGCFFSFLWLLVSVVVAARLNQFWLEFFTLCLALYWFSILTWAYFELRSSYLFSGVKWYQGIPESIPGLHCVFLDEKKQELPLTFRVSRFDPRGAFLYLEASSKKQEFTDFFKKNKKKKWNLSFQFSQQEIQCQAHPVVFFNQTQGLGVQFFELSPDQQKELVDFHETLRGVGYV